MPIPTFTPPIEPSPGTGRKTTFSMFAADFGDGYSQPTPNGLNYRQRELSLSWDALTDAQADTIAEFFDSVGGGHKPFWFIAPREVSATKWTCKDGCEDSLEAGYRKITLKLKQSFSLEP